MSRRTRLVLTAIFIAGFVITAPLTLLYTAGYKYDWKKSRVQKTGIIQIDSLPTKADVILNGTPTGRLTPTPVTRLLPEEYRVRLKKTGYFPWEKTVEVRSSETTFVTGAVLLRDIAPQRINEEVASSVSFNEDGTRLAYVRTSSQGDELVTMLLSATRAENAVPTIVARFSPGTLVTPHLLWSPDGTSLLLVATVDRSHVIVRYDVAGDLEPIELHEPFPAGPLSAEWSDNGARVVITTADGVFLADPENGSTAPAVLEKNVRAARLIGRDIYLLRSLPDGVVLERRGTVPGSDAQTVTLLPNGAHAFLADEGPYLLIADRTRGKIAIISKEDGEIAEILSATDAHWLKPSREPRILACNDFEITVANPGSDTRQLVTRIGTDIDGCAWHPSGLAVLYSAGGILHAADLDQREPKNVYDLASFDGIPAFAVDETDEMIRFVSTGDGAGVYERAY